VSAQHARQKGVVWSAGLVVAVGAGVATAHGLFEVALAAGVPTPIAWLYPLITDGLALVAYAATARLAHRGRGYAWTVVVLAAGLSGVAQASFLAGGVASAPPQLRFGVGFWPAIAAAIVAHLVYLLGDPADATGQASRSTADRSTAPYSGSVQPYNEAVQSDAAAVQPPGVQPYNRPALNTPVQPSTAATEQHDTPKRQPVRRAGGPSARERARAAARSHHAQHGQLPSVSQLSRAAEVGRGTAHAVLKELRQERAHLHVVNTSTESRTDS